MITIDGHISGYKFPLTEDDLVRASALKAALQNDMEKLLIEIFHNFIKPFFYPKEQGRSLGLYSKWDDVFECWFALASLRNDSNFTTTETVTQI